LSRPKRILRKNFVVFCEGDTEYNYIDKMRCKQGVHISIHPINMGGGGYSSFLHSVKSESMTNCLAKFIIIDADRMKNHPGEIPKFKELSEYCKIQNQKKSVPIFLILDNPDFEFIACLHDPVPAVPSMVTSGICHYHRGMLCCQTSAAACNPNIKSLLRTCSNDIMIVKYTIPGGNADEPICRY